MNRTFVWAAIVIGILTSFHYAAAETVVSEPFRSAFYPYSQETARHEGITPGMTIGQQNWQVAEKVLPAEILRAAPSR